MSEGFSGVAHVSQSSHWVSVLCRIHILAQRQVGNLLQKERQSDWSKSRKELGIACHLGERSACCAVHGGGPGPLLRVLLDRCTVSVWLEYGRDFESPKGPSGC